MKKLILYFSVLLAANLFGLTRLFGQDITPVFAVDTVSVFDTLTYDAVIYDGSPWLKKTGTVTPNGGTLVAGPSGYYYERQYSGPINARWFGVKGDSSTNNTTAIRAVIAAASPGQTILLPAGNYLVNDEIFVNKSLVIQGIGKPKLIQQTDYTTLFRVTAAGVTIDNVAFQQTGKGDENSWPTGYGAGITIYRTSNATIRNCDFINCGDNILTDPNSPRGGVKSGAGVYITGSSNNIVEKCNFYSCIFGVNPDDYQNLGVGNPGRFFVNNNIVNLCQFVDCNIGCVWDFGGSGGGIDFSPGIISNNTFIKNSYGKIAIKVSTFKCQQKLLITGNTLKGDFGDGIAVLYGSNFTEITNNSINGGYNGINLYNSTGEVVRRITVTNNSITNCRYAGILVYAAIDNGIMGNQLYNNKYGISIENYARNTHISGNNQIHSNTYVGINLLTNIGTVIDGNNIYNNSTDASGLKCGIYVNGITNTLTVSNNIFDYSYFDTPQAVTTQVKSIKALGTYYNYTANAQAGIIKNNYFGRCPDSLSILERNGGFQLTGNKYLNKRTDFGQYLYLGDRTIFTWWGSNTTPPNTGTWKVGDLALRQTPVSRSFSGWICTTAGTPGVWEEFGYEGRNAIGNATKSGNGSTTSFTIPHGLGGAPTFFSIQSTSQAGSGTYYVTADATNLTITYNVAPSSGTNNLTFNWEAKL